MVDFNSFMSPTSRIWLERAVALRSLVRKLDAPFLHKTLNETADWIEQTQKDHAKLEEDAERAYLALESIIFNGIVIPQGMHDLVRRYRKNHPKTAFNAWHLPLRKEDE